MLGEQTEQHVYRIRWRVPVTLGDGRVFVTASPGLPTHVITAQAVKNLNRLAEGCPAGGIMPEALDGEVWALRPQDHSRPVYQADDESPATGDYDLVLVDAHGEPYDPSELVRTRSA